ncbi:site-2 protease family protein [Paenibacillus sp. HJGM_3]|uniref:site-2 protease family protein n=1 Tax=Paenibacillus sp. HJGM_3 TaxID=3379816 RepID=UPI00385CF634
MAGQGKPEKSRWWGVSAIGAFILAQVKTLVSILQLGKTGSAILSAGVAILFYAWMYQWEFAIGVVIMVLFHEFGHVLAARRKGIPVTAPFFIPFLGALIMMKRNPRDAVTEAYIAIGGPILGSAAAFVCLCIAWATNHPLFYSIAYIGFVLNLINLLPIHPLDGGRIANTVTRWMWVAGLFSGILIVIYIKSILLFIVWALFTIDLFLRFVWRGSKEANYTVYGRMDVPCNQIEDPDWLVKGYQYKGELDYTTYCELDGRQFVEIRWELVGRVKRIEMQEQGIIRRVHSTGVEYKWNQIPKRLVMKYEIDYAPYENDQYYVVSRLMRWKFGLAYGGLALFLLLMLWAIGEQLPPYTRLLHSLTGR